MKILLIVFMVAALGNAAIAIKKKNKTETLAWLIVTALFFKDIFII